MNKIYCSHCGKEIKEEFIVANDNEVYCKDCTEEYTFTNYRVGGEFISLKDEIKHWENCLEEYKKTDDEHMITFYRRKLESAKSRYNEHFGE